MNKTKVCLVVPRFKLPPKCSCPRTSAILGIRSVTPRKSGGLVLIILNAVRGTVIPKYLEQNQ